MVTVRVRNFVRYKGRKDVTHNSWFRCSNRLLEDPDFYDFLSDELLAWIYILSVCSQKNCDTVTINFDHAEKVCRIRKKHFESAIEKLMGKQIDPVDVTPTLRARNVDDTQTCATLQDITDITDITDKQDSNNKPALEKPSQSNDVEFASDLELLKAIPQDTKNRWLRLYNNEHTFIERELIKAFGYYKDRPRKTPKTIRGWCQALSSWFEKNWAKYVTSIESGPKKAGVFDFLDDKETA